MLPDPLTIAASYVLAADMPKTKESPSEFSLTVGSVRYKFTVQNQVAKGRRRTNMKLGASSVVTNPYDSSTSVDDTTTISMVIDRSESLVADANVLIYLKEFFGCLDIAAFANLTTTRAAAIIAGEV
jgi:hypothetical protein